MIRKTVVLVGDRHTPNGTFKRWCPACLRGFRTDNPRVVYCSESCKSRTQNHRFYLRHRSAMITRVLRRRHRRIC